VGVADDVLVVANDVERHLGFGARVVPDVIPGSARYLAFMRH
jgi:hypothetical protein